MPLALATLAGCRTNALIAYFGEQRAEPCGHCSFCLEGEAGTLPAAAAIAPLPAGVDADELARAIAEHPAALTGARQQARFLCGIASPASTRARLGRHPLFGRLGEQRFADVLAWRTGGTA
jgi:ATP-dependent DNA helicase RecQ